MWCHRVCKWLKGTYIGAQSSTTQRNSLEEVRRIVIVEELFSARVLKSLAEVRGLVIQDIKEVEVVRQQEQQGDKREEGDEVKGEVEEISRNAHSAHAT